MKKYYLALLAVFVTDAVVLPISPNIKTILLMLICLLAWGWYNCKPRCRVCMSKGNNKIVFLYIPIVTILLSQLVNMDFSMGYEYKILLLLGSFAFASMICFHDFIEAFVKVMLVVAIVSIVVWVMTFSGLDLWSGFPQTGENQYYTLGITAVPTHRPLWYRNFGPFWEPGVYHIYLNFCLAYILLFKKEASIIQLIIFLTALISTFSTTGYACFMLIMLAFLLSRFRALNFKVVLILVGIAIGVFLLLSNEYVFAVVFGKIIDGGKTTEVRMLDSKLYLEMFLQDPFFGVGLTSAYNQVQALYMKLGVNYSGASSTTFREFASMGLYLGLIRLVLQWKFSKMFLGNKILPAFIMFGVILIMLNTEDLCFSFFMNIIFYYSILRTNKNGKEKLNYCYSKL